VLEACNEIQEDKTSERFNTMLMQIDKAMASQQALTKEQLARVRDQIDSIWDLVDGDISVSPDEIATKLQMQKDTVLAVLTEFALGTEFRSPHSVVEDFTMGDNALRTNPLVSDENARFMLVHPSLVLPAIRENFEQRLKGSPFWEEYQTRRGKYLEAETRDCLSRVLPGSQTLSGFEYFIPADAAEESGSPAGYTKLVEGDLLFLLDDVAVIAEAKAVALAPNAALHS
jgi:hypothetical protein